MLFLLSQLLGRCCFLAVKSWLCTYIHMYMYVYKVQVCIIVHARVIWPATFARSAGPPGGQKGRSYIYRRRLPVARLGGLA